MSLEVFAWCTFGIFTLFTISTVIFQCMTCSSLVSIGDVVSTAIKKLTEDEKPIKRENLFSMYV
ncbi:hypothetical protein FACS189472_08530 [Alphaproteobacteria bacterium]|nr:hypothetical protein FACS189472_08530 [Alphaproteobacteria bacterium]